MNARTPLVAVTGGLLLGGSTTFLLNLGLAFRERGITLLVVCLGGENEMAADFAEAGIEVYPAPDTTLIYEDRLRLVYAKIASVRPKGVLACLGGDSFEVLRLLPRHVARVGAIQSDDPGPYILARQFAPWLDAIVGVSETICDRLREESLGQHVRIEHIPYGIHFGPAQPAQPRDASKPLRIVYLGRIIETQKRVSRLVELIKLLAAKGENFEFTFGGSGPELQSCRDALQKFPNVRFLGEVPNNAVGELLRASDVFVLLSDYEGLPLSLLEAMGCGVVPVVSDIESGMRHIVTRQIGARVPIADVPAACEAIMALARDPARRAALAAAASDSVRRQFSAALMAERYLKLIGELAKEEAAWPARVSIPIPVSGGRWYHQSWARPFRRVLKRAVSPKS